MKFRGAEEKMLPHAVLGSGNDSALPDVAEDVEYTGRGRKEASFSQELFWSTG